MRFAEMQKVTEWFRLYAVEPNFSMRVAWLEAKDYAPGRESPLHFRSNECEARSAAATLKRHRSARRRRNPLLHCFLTAGQEACRPHSSLRLRSSRRWPPSRGKS